MLEVASAWGILKVQTSNAILTAYRTPRIGQSKICGVSVLHRAYPCHGVSQLCPFLVDQAGETRPFVQVRMTTKWGILGAIEVALGPE